MNIDVVWNSGNGRKKISISSPSTGSITTTTIGGRNITVMSTTKVTFNGDTLSTSQKTIHTKKIAIKTAINKKKPEEKKPKTKPSLSILPSASPISILPSASPPLPPMWSERCTETIASLATYKLFPVDTTTSEYYTIAELLYPAEILTVDQVVNPILWSRFVKTRKDMLHSKSDDTELLSQLQLSEAELMTSYQYSLNFRKDPRVAAVPYNDNMALLFHCTRRSENIENILCQGLDERMCGDGGLLGRGIYFTDNPEKSMTYDGCGGIIFIFAVLLGDCISVDHKNDKKYYVREPEKVKGEKRNLNDLFFDSIVAKPGKYGDNEYVVYNRYQCCPLYIIEYSQSQEGLDTVDENDDYGLSRQYLPPLCWMPAAKDDIAVPIQSANCDWPFYAKLLFSKMEEKEEQFSEKKKEDVAVFEQAIAIDSTVR